MHRFFIPSEWISDDAVIIKGNLVHQMKDVLRLRKGDHIAVLDGSGREYEVVLQKVSSESAEGRVRATRTVVEPSVKITLYQALLKGSKLEFTLQKCTEIGVSRFVPVVCEHCIANTPGSKKLERWQKIIIEAAEQSGRGKFPNLEPAMPFQQACQSMGKLAFIAMEGETIPGLRSCLKGTLPIQSQESTPTIDLFIGPEGGFSKTEVDYAQHCGILPVSLGNRTLRAETAGLVAATAILYEWGNLDPVPPSGSEVA
jgi:16S rRNA (uracil1498-N3)-methyltransferase